MLHSSKQPRSTQCKAVTVNILAAGILYYTEVDILVAGHTMHSQNTSANILTAGYTEHTSHSSKYPLNRTFQMEYNFTGANV
jgi:hypothetical protein